MFDLSILSFGWWQVFCSWIWALTISWCTLSQLVPFGTAQWVISMPLLFLLSLFEAVDCPSSRKWLQSAIEQNIVICFISIISLADVGPGRRRKFWMRMFLARWLKQLSAKASRRRVAIYVSISQVFVRDRWESRWSATLPTWASSLSLLFGQASHLPPFRCCRASAGALIILAEPGALPQQLSEPSGQFPSFFLSSQQPRPLSGVCLFVSGLRISPDPLVKSSGCLPETLGPLGLYPGLLPGVKLGLGPDLDHLFGVSRPSFLPLFFNHTFYFLVLCSKSLFYFSCHPNPYCVFYPDFCQWHFQFIALLFHREQWVHCW